MGFSSDRFSAWLHLPRRIGLAGLAHVTHTGLVALRPHVDIRIDRGLDGGPRADLNVDGVALAAVDQTMADTVAGLPAGGVARLENGLAVVLAQHQFALQHID